MIRLSLACLALLATVRAAHAQPGIEGYWGYSDIKVRLSTPEAIHAASLDLSPRYYEADTIPPKSIELMDLGAQLTERTEALGKLLKAADPAEHTRILDAYVRLNVRCFGENYANGQAKIFRLAGTQSTYVISPGYEDRYWRYVEPVMYDRGERARLRHDTRGEEVPDADSETDRRLVTRHLTPAYKLHLELLSGEEPGDDVIWKTLLASEGADPDRDVIVKYLRYNLARRLIAKATAERYPSDKEVAVAEAQLIQAKYLLELVRSAGGPLHTASLHKLADVEIARFRLGRGDKPALLHLEEGLRLLRLCKEQGDPTAVGAIATVIRRLGDDSRGTSYADFSARPETRTALACYVNLTDVAAKSRTSPGQVRMETEWIEQLESLGLRNDPAFIRLAANFHDIGAKESCLRVLALCPPGDGIVQLMRAHLAIDKNDRAAALGHLQMAETDLRAKALRHRATIAGHFEYGLGNETEMMYGRVLVEQASLLMSKGDFLGAARKLRLSGMDHFNQEYVQGCLLTNEELRLLADEENPRIRYVYHPDWNDDSEKGPMARRDASSVSFVDEIDGRRYSSARITLARRLLQEGRFQESLPYWDLDSRPYARSYAEFMNVAQDASRPAQARGLAYWQAALILRENPNLWACSAGHEFSDGQFVPRYAMANRAATKDLSLVCAEEHARIEKSKAWTAPRNSFFRYGVAEHCQKAAELLQGEQSAYVLWFGALNLAYLDRKAAAPMREKLLQDYGTTKIGRQAIAAKGLPRHVDAPEMK
jgi:hypothetical protein